MDAIFVSQFFNASAPYKLRGNLRKKYWLAERLQELQALISKLFMDF